MKKQKVGDLHAEMHRIARDVFGFESLRQEQEDAIAGVLAGRDTLVVMPTGSGKSAIYQIAALMLDGPTIVVSPLIALQKDQAESLNSNGMGSAAVVNSLITEQAREAAISEAEQGATEFLFMAPEQFANPDRMAAVKAARPSLFVVDEAHCISEWGHSFRPDYLRLGTVIEELGHPTVLALTATANEAVRAEISVRLGLRDPQVFVHGFDRPNLWLGVETAASEDKKRAMLLQRVRDSERPGIVYTSTRKHAEQIRDELNNVGISAAFYHGGLKKSDRETMQEQFMRDEVEVIVATSAFGMGVDKPNVRFVFHFAPPDSVDAYYQEIGRAGRDGKPASTVLFYNPKDLALHKFFKGGGQIGAADVQGVIDVLEQDGETTLADLQEKTGLSKVKLSRALNRLEEAGALVISTESVVRPSENAKASLELAEEAASAQAEMHRADLERIENIRRYAEHMECRRAYLINYFGEEYADGCNNCDNCQGAGTARAVLIAETRMECAADATAAPQALNAA